MDSSVESIIFVMCLRWPSKPICYVYRWFFWFSTYSTNMSQVSPVYCCLHVFSSQYRLLYSKQRFYRFLCQWEWLETHLQDSSTAISYICPTDSPRIISRFTYTCLIVYYSNTLTSIRTFWCSSSSLCIQH